MPCDPNALLAQSQCLITCIPPGMVRAVKVSLLCNIAAARTPQGVAGLAHWWRADSLVALGVANGGAVGGAGAEWVDKVAGAIASQATANLRPTLVTSSINAKPAVKFEGFFSTNSDNLDFLPTFTMTGDFTTFVVAQFTNFANGCSHAFLNGAPLNCAVGVFKSATNYGSQTRVDSGANQSFAAYSGVNPDTVAHCITNRRSGAAAGNQSAFFNGAQQQTLTLNGTYTVTRICLGAPTFAVDYSVVIPEILHYNRALTDAEVVSVYTNYLKRRYALP